jgi:hypothetical protein
VVGGDHFDVGVSEGDDVRDDLGEEVLFGVEERVDLPLLAVARELALVLSAGRDDLDVLQQLGHARQVHLGAVLDPARGRVGDDVRFPGGRRELEDLALLFIVSRGTVAGSSSARYALVSSVMIGSASTTPAGLR